jgi:uncharacterized protein (TIGR00288 family)
VATTGNSTGPQHQLAVFIDFENLALGLAVDETFEIRRVLDRLLEKGKVIVKVAYADWDRFRPYTQKLHENGIELIEIPRRATSGKNSADIRLCVDAMDLAWSKEHIDTFAILSGDSDFSPLVAKLKENGKQVIGLGMRESTSPLLANACDEFIYYEDLVGGSRGRGGRSSRAPKDTEAEFNLLVETVRALERDTSGLIQASLVKDTMKRKRPTFSEGALGYGSFSEMLEAARDAGFVTLRKDERSGTYAVTAAHRGSTQRAPAPRGATQSTPGPRGAAPEPAAPSRRSRGRRAPRAKRDSAGSTA